MRRYGVEVETSQCSEDVIGVAESEGWSVVEDISVTGMEFVSPPMRGHDGYLSIDYVVSELLMDEGTNVDNRCGLHVHVDLSDTDSNQRRAIALAYHYTEPIWRSWVAPHRRDTRYARTHSWNRSRIVRSNRWWVVDDRYVWQNWAAYRRHRTLEIRSHQGTINPNEVIDWVKAHTRFVDYVQERSVGWVTRVFGNQNRDLMLRELKHILGSGLVDRYEGKFPCLV